MLSITQSLLLLLLLFVAAAACLCVDAEIILQGLPDEDGVHAQRAHVHDELHVLQGYPVALAEEGQDDVAPVLDALDVVAHVAVDGIAPCVLVGGPDGVDDVAKDHLVGLVGAHAGQVDLASQGEEHVCGLGQGWELK